MTQHKPYGQHMAAEIAEGPAVFARAALADRRAALAEARYRAAGACRWGGFGYRMADGGHVACARAWQA